MKFRKCLVVDPVHPGLFALLEGAGWSADYFPDITREEIRARIGDYEGLVIRSKTIVNDDLLQSAHNLKFIARAGAGLDNIDHDAVAARNIAVLHAAEGNRDAVGEFAVGLLLSLLRNIPRAHEQVCRQVWDREGNRGEEIMGKTIGLIGYGNMGTAFARRLSGFGCKVLAYDKYKSRFTDNFCRESAMEEIYAESDVLSLHIPLTRETRKLVDRDYLQRFAKDIVLVNTARGEIVSLTDLAEAIRSGKVRGAALDVLENEKINELTPEQLQSFNYLKGKTNVIFTPHIAGWTYESHEKINVALVNKLKALNI